MVQKLIDTKEFLEKLNEEIMNAVNDEDYDEEAVCEYDWVSGMWISTKLINKVLESTPAIEAEPVRHGKWEVHEAFEYKDMTCSVCGWLYEYYGGLEEEWNYCPHCGCKMDLDEVEE